MRSMPNEKVSHSPRLPLLWSLGCVFSHQIRTGPVHPIDSHMDLDPRRHLFAWGRCCLDKKPAARVAAEYHYFHGPWEQAPQLWPSHHAFRIFRTRQASLDAENAG